MALRFSTHQRAAIRDIIEPLAQLRIAVFFDYPYLYEGTMDYESHYLERYAGFGESIVFAVWDGDHMIGATTGMPLKDEMADIRQPFEIKNREVASIFYFGESVLLPAYRGQGLGHRFFDEREAFARGNGYATTAFCSVIRPNDHPMRPVDYRSNDAFWIKRGYEKQPDLFCQMAWLDRGEARETLKTLQFWQKAWK